MHQGSDPKVNLQISIKKGTTGEHYNREAVAKPARQFSHAMQILNHSFL